MAELKHTYSKPNLVISNSIKNIHQDLPGIDRDNTLGIGTTAFWHKGMLRITAGVNYFWEKAEIFGEEEGMNSKTSKYSNFAIFKLAPQLSLPAGWRLTSNMIWCTRRHTLTPAYTPANLYAEVGVYKNIGKHLTLEADSTISPVSISATVQPPWVSPITSSSSGNNSERIQTVWLKRAEGPKAPSPGHRPGELWMQACRPVRAKPSSTRQYTKLLPLQGALLTASKPRAVPWARSFCPFRAYWVISSVQFGRNNHKNDDPDSPRRRRSGFSFYIISMNL